MRKTYNYSSLSNKISFKLYDVKPYKTGLGFLFGNHWRKRKKPMRLSERVLSNFDTAKTLNCSKYHILELFIRNRLTTETIFLNPNPTGLPIKITIILLIVLKM